MKRPAVYALLFLLAGIMAGQYAPGLLLLCAGALVLLCCLLFHRYRYWPVFLFLLFALAGSLRVRDSLQVTITEATETVKLHGIVYDTGVTGSGNQKLIVDIAESGLNDHTQKAARIIAYLKPQQYAEAGDRITMSGKLLPLEKPRNPGEYNEFLTLRARKIDAKIFPWALEIHDSRISVMTVLNRFKDRLASVYDKALPEQEAALIKSVVLGDKAGLSDDTRDLFKLAGIFHLLCISGLHVSIIMLAINQILRSFMNERYAGIAALLVMIAYCLMTGAAISTVRAVTMCGIAVFARVCFREYNLLISTACACIVLLLYEPLYLFDVGFQLSFGAVFGIAVLTGPIEHALTLARLPFKSRFKNTLAANIAATAATAPILCFHFYYFPTYSLLVNLIILPTASLLVVSGLLIGLIGLITLPVAVFIAGVVYYLLKFYFFVCSFFTSLPLSACATGGIGPVVFLASLGVMLAFAYMFSGYGETVKKRAVVLTGSLLILIVCAFLHAFPAGLALTVLDAEGENFFVLSYQTNTIVIGSAAANREVLLHYLNRLGAQRVDGFFLTGPTDVYRDEIENIKSQFRVGQLYLPGGEGGKVTYGGVSVEFDNARLRVEYDDALIDCVFENYSLDETRRADLVIVPPGSFIAYESLPEDNARVYSTRDNGALQFWTDGKIIKFSNDLSWR